MDRTSWWTMTFMCGLSRYFGYWQHETRKNSTTNWNQACWGDLAGKPQEFLPSKLQTFQGHKKIVEDFLKLNRKATVASNRVALRIAKAGREHTTGETLVLPAAKDLCSVMLGEAAASKIDTVPLSDNTIIGAPQTWHRMWRSKC